MNTVKKFKTFEELKSFESKPEKYPISKKKHNEFEKVIMNIRSIKISQDNQFTATKK
jgi:hypothetical protein